MTSGQDQSSHRYWISGHQFVCDVQGPGQQPALQVQGRVAIALLVHYRSGQAVEKSAFLAYQRAARQIRRMRQAYLQSAGVPHKLVVADTHQHQVSTWVQSRRSWGAMAHHRPRRAGQVTARQSQRNPVLCGQCLRKADVQQIHSNDEDQPSQNDTNSSHCDGDPRCQSMAINATTQSADAICVDVGDALRSVGTLASSRALHGGTA